MISAVIIAKNEEKNITACMSSVDWADEIVVIDNHSEDRTVELAKQGGATVYVRDLERDFASQRNYGLEVAQYEWVLFLDADERVSESLSTEIAKFRFPAENRKNGYYIHRKDFLWGKKLNHGENGSTKLLRFARKDSGKWVGNVHEVWQVKGAAGELTGELFHFPHQTVREFLQEINFYTDIRAEELFKQNVKSSWMSILLYTKGKFFQNYLLRLGFLDGIPGIVSATIMSFHSFLVRSKLWLLWQKENSKSQASNHK